MDIVAFERAKQILAHARELSPPDAAPLQLVTSLMMATAIAYLALIKFQAERDPVQSLDGDLENAVQVFRATLREFLTAIDS